MTTHRLNRAGSLLSPALEEAGLFIEIALFLNALYFLENLGVVHMIK